ncbi:MAG: efflux RND transporter periplasmic adaptor subunit [Candidatus Krumholzibacteriia bacterium]
MRFASLKPKPMRAAAAGLVLLAAFGLGYVLRGGGAGVTHEHAAVEPDAAPTMWTCSMHPQIHLPKPGKCPICFMDLIPVETGPAGPDESSRRLVMSESARKLAEVQTTEVRYREVEAEIRMAGKVEYDETRLAHLTAWVPGRLDRLYVDYTGIEVRKGDHMVSLYSPELLAAQQELLEALRAVERLARSDIPEMRRTAQATVEAARDKLRLWGLTPEQIAEIEHRGQPTDHMTIYAPTGGIVVEKPVAEGMYVGVGTRIYTIADLSKVWVLLDAYESDMSWIRYGQEVEFETEAYPGQRFLGRISFIDPVLNAKTRTVKVRVNVDNSDLKLKPEMFVRAVVRARVDAAGRVMDPELSGKWVCPMHPEVVENRPGSCNQCGMDLVSAESLGYVAVDAGTLDLVIPAAAVLQTGRRAVVYVRVPGAEQPTYEGREVALGPRAGDSYLVKSGLHEGERVVSNGAFSIDSALQIQARPSRMSPEGGVPQTGHAGHGGPSGAERTPRPVDARAHEAHGESAEAASAPSPSVRGTVSKEFLGSMSPLYVSYFALRASLAADDLAAARAAFEELGSTTQSVRMELLQAGAHTTWMQVASRIRTSATEGAKVAELGSAREVFHAISNAVIEVDETFGHPGDATHFRFHCPMAFDNRGADWLQTNETVSNPYFGVKMPRCGVVKDQLRSSGGRQPAGAQ